MACYGPLLAYRDFSRLSKNNLPLIRIVGKRDSDSPVDNLNNDALGERQYFYVPCGSCIGCRVDKSREWALRCVHEASLYDENCFITLTYSPEHLPPNGSLVKSDFQKFMKRLRKNHCGKEPIFDETGFAEYPIRYFHCGEYGEEFSRPHHHALLFNFNFDDREVIKSTAEATHYYSETLEKLWGLGMCSLGDCTYSSAAYVARYCTKKLTGDAAAEHYIRYDDEGQPFYIEPEYITMSRRPGIGKRWFDEFKEDIYKKDHYVHEGKIHSAPDYYDKVLGATDPDRLRLLKTERRIKAETLQPENNTLERLHVRKLCKNANVKSLKRGFEK